MATRFAIFLLLLVCASEVNSMLSRNSEDLQNEAEFIRSRAKRTAHKLKNVGRKKLSGVSDGSKIVFGGMVADEAERFNVTLRNQRSNEDSLVLSFNILKKEVALNSFFDGEWDFAELRKSPLRAGDEFNIEIVVGKHEYLITVNKFWMAQYSHRIDFSKLSHAVLSGDVVVEKIQYNESERDNAEDDSFEDSDEDVSKEI